MDKKNFPLKDEPVERSYEIPDLRAITGEEEGAYIEGHPAVFDHRSNIYGMFWEVIERGAFDETDFDDVLFSGGVNHDYKKIPLARSRRNNKGSTMQLKTDDKGLHIRANLDVDSNPDAKSLHSSVSRGDVDAMSLTFFVKEERWEDMDKDMPTRRILKIKKVREVTAASLPLSKGTDINARGQHALDNAARVLENARSALDNEKNEQQAELLKLKAQILMKG